MAKKHKQPEKQPARRDRGSDAGARPMDPDARERDVQRKEEEDTGAIEPARGPARRTQSTMPDGTVVEGDAGGAEDEAIEGDRKGRQAATDDEDRDNERATD